MPQQPTPKGEHHCVEIFVSYRPTIASIILIAISQLFVARLYQGETMNHALIGLVWSGEKEGVSASALFPLSVNSSSVPSFSLYPELKSPFPNQAFLDHNLVPYP